MEIHLDKRAVKMIRLSAQDAIEEGDTEALREDILEAFSEDQTEEIERRLDSGDFFEFLTDMLDEWSVDDVDELFELVETQLGELGIDLKYEAKGAAADEEDEDAEPDPDDDDEDDDTEEEEEEEEAPLEARDRAAGDRNIASIACCLSPVACPLLPLPCPYSMGVVAGSPVIRALKYWRHWGVFAGALAASQRTGAQPA